MAQPMHELLSYAQQLTDAIPGVLGRALADHEAIAAAVALGDAPAARDAMRAHLDQTRRDIISLTEAP
jgi:DNA-binding FadR family transcriptional regulator